MKHKNKTKYWKKLKKNINRILCILGEGKEGEKQ